MVELYISWCRGLPSDPEAVRIVKDCPLVAGVELCADNHDVAEAQAAGLGLSLHNPLRSAKLGLQDIGFAAAALDSALVKVCEGAPVIGFHLLNERAIVGPEPETARRCVEHLKSAASAYGPRTAFETTAYSPDWVAPRYMTDPSFIAKLLEESGTGLVFDTSHTFIAATNRAKETGQSPDEYLRDLLAASRGRVLQLHLNVPAFIEGDCRDVHGTFVDGDPLGERMLALARDVLSANPGLKVLTLEMDTHTPPAEHARIMVAQAQFVAKRLGLLTVLT